MNNSTKVLFSALLCLQVTINHQNIPLAFSHEKDYVFLTDAGYRRKRCSVNLIVFLVALQKETNCFHRLNATFNSMAW